MSEVSELDTLKARADQMGISYHPSIGVDKLREKVNEALMGNTQSKAGVTEAPAQKSIEERRKEASRLIRINITCMNPAKKDWPGEIFTTGNSNIGTFRKFVPFGTEDGYHVPKIIYDMLKARKFQAFRTVKSKNGVKVVESYMANEFAIEDLPALTEEELEALRKDQAARGGV